METCGVALQTVPESGSVGHTVKPADPTLVQEVAAKEANHIHGRLDGSGKGAEATGASGYGADSSDPASTGVEPLMNRMVFLGGLASIQIKDNPSSNRGPRGSVKLQSSNI